MAKQAPEKIAVLGGGVASMAAAWYLSSQPDWRERYAITVYQQGWRLGGKGASGRNAQHAQRIEEHGPHVWFGFYSNAFSLMKAAYAALDRAPGAPLATWRDAFAQQDYVVMAEQIEGQWRHWHAVFPALAGEPGPGAPTSTRTLGLALLRWIAAWTDAAYAPALAPPSHGIVLRALAHALAPDSPAAAPLAHARLARSLVRLRTALRATRGVIEDDSARRLRSVLDIATTILKGMFDDGIFADGFDAANGVDLRAWLARHGGDPELCVNSAPVRAFYDLVFGYPDGDFSRPNAEAGTMLRGIMRVCVGYQGGMMYKMQAGMGDIVFAPLYLALAARGVQFRFFHQVEELVPDGDAVGSIRITRQAALAHETYDPLVTVKDLACWPSTPLYAQLDAAQAALLREQGVDLESYWSDWPALYHEAFGTPLPELMLQRGRDFDKIVLGIPLGSLPAVCPQLLANSPALQACARYVLTVSTQAYQVWMGADLAQLGWPRQPQGQQPVLSGFSSPYDTWTALDHLVAREDWPAGGPVGVSYFCSAMPMTAYPPRADHGFPARCAALAKQAALNQLTGEIGALWPAAVQDGDFAWHWLAAPIGVEGPARFDSQYWRANVDPSERYVLSVAGSARYRLKAGASGFSNLFLAGDWLKTGIDAGCIEGAVMGGMQASRAISGHPALIEGESDD